MKFSPMTCERLSAVEQYRGQQTLLRDQLDGQLKDAKKIREESREALMQAIHDARSEFKDAPWPEPTVKIINGHAGDFDRRSLDAARIERAKKEHAAEAERSSDLIIQIIRDAREGAGLYDQDPSGQPLYRAVPISDVCDEVASEALSHQSVLTIGDFQSALISGRLDQIMKEKLIGPRIFKRGAEAVRAFANARGFTLEGDVPDPEPEPLDDLPPQKADPILEPKVSTEPVL